MKISAEKKKNSFLKNSAILLLCVLLLLQTGLPALASTTESDVNKQADLGLSSSTVEASEAGEVSLGLSSRAFQLTRGFSESPNEYEIYPVPHSLNYGVSEQFLIGTTVNIILESEVDIATKDFLLEVLGKYNIAYTVVNNPVIGEFNIMLGINGSGETVDDYVGQGALQQNNELFSKIDSYLLNAQRGLVSILGEDSDGVYYGVATLKMMLSSFGGEYLVPVHIEDWAEMETRGFIEGFYGGWNYTGRASLMRSARDVKMNSYVYASKSDAYHTDKWAVLYPESEIEEMQTLVAIGEETKVRFAWSVHLKTFFSGLDVTQDPALFDERYNKLTAKFDQLHAIGINRIDILNDDFGSGSTKDVVTLLNRLMNDYFVPNGMESPIYCPQGYNTAWSGNGAELNTLRDLDPRITIYWTGSDVNSPIEQTSIDYAITKSNHNPVFWINYPVNEHAGSGIFLGNINHYARDGITGLAGAVSNPSLFTETNKVGIFQLAALFWNNQNFSQYSDELWEDCFKYLQPEVSEQYKTIARNVSNAPNSGRVGNSFPESEYIKEALELVLSQALGGKDIRELAETGFLLTEFDNILAAIESFRQNCNNAELIRELNPWLKSLKDAVTSGREAMLAVASLNEKNANQAWTHLSAASLRIETWDSYLGQPTKPGSAVAKAGSKRIQPFASKLIPYITNQLTPLLNPEDPNFIPSFYGVMGGVVQGDDANTGKIFDADDESYATFQINQRQNDYFGVDLGRSIAVNDIEILQGQNDTHHDFFHKAILEYSVNGEEWITLVPLVESHQIRSNNLNIRARYVRLRLVETGSGGSQNYWTYVREFSINKSTKSYEIYTDSQSLPNIDLGFDGSFYQLTNSSSDITLPADGYLGIKLPKIIGLLDVTTTPDLPLGINLEYSLNGVEWERVASPSQTYLARYVRMHNPTADELSYSFKELAALISSPMLSPSIIETSLSKPLKEGIWENIFDGKRDTFAWTNEQQKTGQYYLVDLGAPQPLHDIAIITADGQPRVYGGEISISLDNISWTIIATTVDGDTSNNLIDPPYRFFKGDGGGSVARYIKLELTSDKDSFLKIHEIEINKSAEKEPYMGAFSGNPTGDFERMLDGNVSTSFTPGLIEQDDGYFEYVLSESLDLENISILQDPDSICNATVKVQHLNKSWTTLGQLNQSASLFLTKELGSIAILRVEWVRGTSPAIAEIFFSSGESTTTPNEKDPVFYPNIYSVPKVNEVTVNHETPWQLVGLPSTVMVTLSNQKTVIVGVKWSSPKYNNTAAGEYPTFGQLILTESISNPANLFIQTTVTVKPDGKVSEITGNLALNQPVEVSGAETNTYTGNLAVDGIVSDNSRWSGNKMKEKNDTNPANQVAGGNWISVDLGVGYNTIDELIVTYHAKAHGTNYEIQMSEDNQSWTTVQQIDQPDTQAQNATYTHVLTTPAHGRYLKVVYNKMNINALAATGISIRELVVNGSKSSAPSVEENLALQKTVKVSGVETPSFTGELAVDGNTATRWCSNLMKSTQNQSNTLPQNPSWIIVDLGNDVAKIHSTSLLFFNLVYGTEYEVQISDSDDPAGDWDTIKTVSKAHYGTGNPKDELLFSTPIVGKRYMRIYFTQMNVAAAGHAVGLAELTVMGTRVIVSDPVIESVEEQLVVDVLGTSFEFLPLPERVVVQLADQSTVSLPVIWDSTTYDSGQGIQLISGELMLSNGITNPLGIRAESRLVLEPTPKVVSAKAKDIIVRWDTSFQSLNLPENLPVDLENGHVAKLNVRWEKGVYDPKQVGSQTLYGSITLSDKVKNDDDVKATVLVKVLDQVVDIMGLRSLINDIENKITTGYLKPENYTQQSWSALHKSLKAGNDMLLQSPDQSTVDAMVDEVLVAFNGLVKDYPQEKQKLSQDMIAIKAQITSGILSAKDYSTESWNDLNYALNQAEQLLSKTATKQELLDMIQTLEEALSNLKSIPPVITKPNFKLIETLIAKGKALTSAQYTTASWELLSSALSQAEKLIDNVNATQIQIDLMYDKLENAIKELEKIVEEGSKNTGSSSSSESTGSTEGSGSSIPDKSVAEKKPTTSAKQVTPEPEYKQESKAVAEKENSVQPHENVVSEEKTTQEESSDNEETGLDEKGSDISIEEPSQPSGLTADSEAVVGMEDESKPTNDLESSSKKRIPTIAVIVAILAVTSAVAGAIYLQIVKKRP